jgi:hypothetical protein
VVDELQHVQLHAFAFDEAENGHVGDDDKCHGDTSYVGKNWSVHSFAISD